MGVSVPAQVIDRGMPERTKKQRGEVQNAPHKGFSRPHQHGPVPREYFSSEGLGSSVIWVGAAGFRPDSVEFGKCGPDGVKFD